MSVMSQSVSNGAKKHNPISNLPPKSDATVVGAQGGQKLRFYGLFPFIVLADTQAKSMIFGKSHIFLESSKSKLSYA